MTLLHVPTLHILVIQRTNKTFQHTIESSVAIQRKLFFKHDPNNNDVNQLGCNPFLRKYGTPVRRHKSKFSTDVDITHMVNTAPKTASWRNMLVSMPAPKRLDVTRVDERTHWYQGYIVTLEECKKGDGIRMWQLADVEWENGANLERTVYLEVWFSDI